MKKSVFSAKVATVVCTLYRGKWKENPESDSTIDVAVKHPSGAHHVEYEIATLRKANGHSNILNFLGQIKYGPNRYIK